MSVEQFIAIMGAVTALVGVLGGILVQLRQTHTLINSRMTQLLDVSKTASHAEGVLDERQAQKTVLLVPVGDAPTGVGESPTGTEGQP